MPPKPKSPVKGKKPKQTKAEKEKLKKEEADRKLKEEEEARLKAEQEENERLERERLEHEERARIEAEEKEQHTAEVTELSNILHGNATALRNLLEDRRSKAKWDRYMLCNGSPDPTVPGEINTYINLWKEDKDRSQIDCVLNESKLTLSLIEEVEEHLKSLMDDELSDTAQKNLKETVADLEALISHKMDQASLHLLKMASEMADTETGNLQIVRSSPEITLMMWGNLTKNPRFKTFEFESEKQGFELPKQLALSDIAVRMIKTKYDHYSHHCKTYELKKKKPPPVVEVTEEEKLDDETKEGEPDEEKEVEDSEEKENKEQTENEESKEEEKKEGETPAPDTTEGEEETKTEQEGDAVEEEKKEGEQDEEDDDDYDDEEEDEDVVVLRAYQVLGRVMTFEILGLPPQPKAVQSWIMTQMASDELRFIQYPSNSSDSKLNATLSGTLPMGQTLDSKAIAATEMLGAPPIGVTMRLPDDVLYSEEPQVAYWCPHGKHWRLDGSLDIKYNEENHLLSFKTIKSGPFACIQDRHINMPFQSWELQPIALNHAKLTIIAAIIEVEIEIKGEVCCFRQTPDTDPKPQLESLQNKWMPPQHLIKAMFNVGINLFPEADSKKYVSVQEKDPSNEIATYRQMALTASHFAYSWSKWNSEVSREKIILQGCEQLSVVNTADDKWSVLMISNHRAMQLRVSEDDEEFSDDFAEGTQFHADLYHMVCDLSTDPGKERMRQSDFMFIDAVSQLLEATKLLTYA